MRETEGAEKRNPPADRGVEREKGFERFRRWVNYSKQDAPLPFIVAEPCAFPVPSRSAWSRSAPAFGAAAGHMWGTWMP
jgi:hypothetical protein